MNLTFLNEEWVKIKKITLGSCKGYTIKNGKKIARFNISTSIVGTDLRITGHDDRILESLSKDLDRPHLKWVVRTIFRTHIKYAWSKDLDMAKRYFDRLQTYKYSKRIFDFSGIKQIQLL